MIDQGRGGRIINISSISRAGNMGQTNYSAAKAGDIGFVKALAQEGAKKGITVNAICPGYIGTEMVKAIAPEDPYETDLFERAGRQAEAILSDL